MQAKPPGTCPQRGQATSEFIAAMLLFAPLVLGVIYLGKYADIKHQAIQASRYAAFERALDPSTSNENPAMLAEETKARFFADGSRSNGKIGFQDTTSGLSTSGTLNPVWSALNATPMIAQYSDVSVNVTQGSINSGLLSATDTVAQTMFHLNAGGQAQANVEVSLANIAHFAPLSNINLKVGATTVVAGDTWNADGATDVGNHFTIVAVPGRSLSFLNTALSPLYQLLSGTNGPQFGCVKPDVVPNSTAPGANFSPNDNCN
jgi:hypothetical protein